MPTRTSPASETLESRWFLSTASGVAHATPQVAAAVHAAPRATAAATAAESGDGEEGKSAASTAPIVPVAPAAVETEDAGDGAAPGNAGASTPSTEASSGRNSPVTSAADAALPQPVVDVQFNRPRAPVRSGVLTDSSDAAAGGVAAQLPVEAAPVVVAAVFNTRHPINPHDAGVPVATLTSATVGAVTRAVSDLTAGRSPFVLKSTPDGILSLTQGDLLATFADAVTGFAHESAAGAAAAFAAAGDTLTAPETHFYKWQVTLGVLGADALLVGHWYAARRRAAMAKAGHPPFSMKAV